MHSEKLQDAAKNLAEAVAEDMGVDLPVMDSGATPVMLDIPPEMIREGGVGIAIMVIRPPTEESGTSL